MIFTEADQDAILDAVGFDVTINRTTTETVADSNTGQPVTRTLPDIRCKGQFSNQNLTMLGVDSIDPQVMIKNSVAAQLVRKDCTVTINGESYRIKNMTLERSGFNRLNLARN